MSALNLITAINALLGLLTQAGLSWSALSARIAAAKAEGRPFGLQDLEAMQVEAQAAINRLRADIDAARNSLP